jgi:iron complex transport system substrate-binding protein
MGFAQTPLLKDRRHRWKRRCFPNWKGGKMTSLKYAVLFSLGITLILALTACSGQNTPATTPSQPVVSSPASKTASTTAPSQNERRTVVDHLDRTVSILNNPQRIISLHPIATQIIYCLNSQDKMIAFDNISKPRAWVHKIDPQWDKRQVLTFGDSPPNTEAVAALNPDIVIQGAYWPEQVDKVSQVATVVAFNFHSRPTEDAVDLIGKAIGKEKEAQELIKYIKDKTAAITNITSKIPREQRPTTMYETYQTVTGGGFTLSTCGNKAYQHGLIEKAGGVNLGENFPVIWQAVDPEQLLKWDPDVMFMRPPVEGQKNITLQDLKNDVVLNKLTLVSKGKYYLMPDGEFSSPVNAPEGILGLEFMAKKLYPDKFQWLSLENEYKEFYSKWFRYQLSDEEVAQIINP